ncbi:hypothetical protein [Okeania sp. SIO1I7]|uniref:hypothetical protein n=1 Tax=Okeania sp. SIO1I7 TaxID=2607772 RepID=UPI0025FFEEDB|nr:hypothetical protein [Okeania sp. SIO1I7]
MQSLKIPKLKINSQFSILNSQKKAIALLNMVWFLVPICGIIPVFINWVERGRYGYDWGCCCGNNLPYVPDFRDLSDKVGE